MNSYVIEIHGCDDSTVFEMNLTDTEKVFMINLCKLSHKISTYECEPEMNIYRYEDLHEPDYELYDKEEAEKLKYRILGIHHKALNCE